eukprot:5363704-Prymnesium_polylepis.1
MAHASASRGAVGGPCAALRALRQLARAARLGGGRGRRHLSRFSPVWALWLGARSGRPRNSRVRVGRCRPLVCQHRPGGRDPHPEQRGARGRGRHLWRVRRGGGLEVAARRQSVAGTGAGVA